MNKWEEQPPLFEKIADKEYSKLDEKTRKSVNKLIKSIYEYGLLEGLGKPERLKFIDAYSRRISGGDRLVYTVCQDRLVILSVKDHY